VGCWVVCCWLFSVSKFAVRCSLLIVLFLFSPSTQLGVLAKLRDHKDKSNREWAAEWSSGTIDSDHSAQGWVTGVGRRWFSAHFPRPFPWSGGVVYLPQRGRLGKDLPPLLADALVLHVSITQDPFTELDRWSYRQVFIVCVCMIQVVCCVLCAVVCCNVIYGG